MSIVLEENGYIHAQGYDSKPLRRVIPPVVQLLDVCASNGYKYYFTRESHRPDLSTLSARENFRSRNNTGIGIGSQTTGLGRALVRGEPGCAIISELQQYTKDDESQSNVIDKPGRSAFAHTELELMLRNAGIRNLIICGVTTDVCVHSTMREANDRGFDCLLLEDACAAGSEELHNFAIESVQGEGGIFGSTTTVRELLQSLSAA